MSLSAKDRAKLAALGFDVTGKKLINTLNRVIMSVAGKWKSGKTGFALRATPPIMYINLDRRVERSSLTALGVPESNLILKEIRVNRDDTQDHHKQQWSEIYEAYMWALQSSDSIRTIVFDTETMLWELARLAQFGKLNVIASADVRAEQYRILNTSYLPLVSAADRYDKNVIFLRELKEEYANNKYTGNFKPAGFKKMEGWAQVNGIISRETVAVYDEEKEREYEEQEFTFTIQTNGIKAALNGQEFIGDMCSFKWVASMLTGTPPTDWE